MSGVHCQHLGSVLADEAASWVSCHRATQPPFHPFLLLSSLLGHKQLVSLPPITDVLPPWELYNTADVNTVSKAFVTLRLVRNECLSFFTSLQRYPL